MNTCIFYLRIYCKVNSVNLISDDAGESNTGQTQELRPDSQGLLKHDSPSQTGSEERMSILEQTTVNPDYSNTGQTQELRPDDAQSQTHSPVFSSFSNLLKHTIPLAALIFCVVIAVYVYYLIII